MLKVLQICSGLLIACGLLLTGCASHNKVDGPVSTGEEAGEAILNNGVTDETGLVPFFATQPERGLVIKSIDWTKSVSSENPGADCELKRKTTMPAFVCIVREQQEAVVLTIHEDGEGEGVDHRQDQHFGQSASSNRARDESGKRDSSVSRSLFPQ